MVPVEKSVSNFVQKGGKFLLFVCPSFACVLSRNFEARSKGQVLQKWMWDKDFGCPGLWGRTNTQYPKELRLGNLKERNASQTS